jgi:hypothetical protein
MPSLGLTLSLRGNLLNSGAAPTPAFDPTTLFTGTDTGWVYDLSDMSTLFQDAAGTTPVTAVGQPVGLQLDKSKGLVLGPELVTNGGFDTDTFWTKGTGVTISGGVASVTSLAAFSDFLRNETATYTAGTFYEVSVDITAYTSGSIGFLWPAATSFFSGVGTYKFTVAATDSRIRLRTGDTFTGTIDNISVKELPGNHRTQSTALNRPTYARHPLGGIRNLLTRTEEFNDAVWTKLGGTVSANAGNAPDGTTTADKLIETASTTFHGIRPANPAAGLIYTYQVSLKEAERRYAVLSFGGNNTPVSGGGIFVDLRTGDVMSSAGAKLMSHAVVSQGNGWWRYSISVDMTDIAEIPAAFVFLVDNSTHTIGNTYGSKSYAGDGSSGILLWGAQLELGSTATAYQRVGSTFDVTEAGVPDLYYLSYDGINDSLATASFAWGTDKATVVAGVRKLSDAAAGTIALRSPAVGSNEGAFALTAPNPALANSFGFYSRGSVAPSAPASAAFAAPTTNVVTGIGDISGDIAALRVDGTQVAQVTENQGTGDYLAYQTFFGARAGTGVFFNGREYSNVGINRLLTTDELAALESWTAGKTGIPI